jgi:hypothetical protein
MQRTNEKLFGDLKNVQIYFDDIIVYGKSQVEHDEALQAVLARAREVGAKFNKDKFQYRVSSVKYLGRIVSDQGLMADEEHIRPIVELPTPKSKTELMRFLGMVKYMSIFIPNLSHVSGPLRQLTRQDVIWQWNHEHDKAFSEIKQKLVSAPVLGIFDETKQLILQTDSSADGLGACVMQEGRPIAYGSRSLTDTEGRYATIEKELLGIVYGLEKFHNFTYGRSVIVNTDHKPLVSIQQKNLEKIPARLQRLVLRLMKYDVLIKYLPGKQLYIADTLSRAPLGDVIEENEEMKCIVHTLTKYLPMSDARKSEFVMETKNDQVLSKIAKYCGEGWPSHKNSVEDNCKVYWPLQADVHVTEGLVFYNDRLLVPAKLRSYMLNVIHEGHLGIGKCKGRARQVVFWPGMNDDIEKLIGKCSTCQHFANTNVKQSMIPHEVPSRAWSKIASDVLEVGMDCYLVVMDYYSKWIELEKLQNKTAGEIIEKLKDIFSRFGVPDTFISDNMPFASHKFTGFAKEWGFNVVTSSPRYPQSNGLAERAVQMVKKWIKKSKFDGTELSTSLMAYRSTQISGVDLTPSQLLFNRQIKTKIPACVEHLRPRINHGVKDKLEARQERQTAYYDRGARELTPLTEGENVLLNRDNVWESAEVVGVHDTPRSYLVKDENDVILRRNRRFLRKSSCKVPTEIQEEIDKDDGVELRTGQGHRDETEVNPLPLRTRSGRVVRAPSRFDEFQM